MGKLFPTFYDLAMKPLEQGKFKAIRKELLEQATGRVLEIGSGTGVNFPYYKKASKVDAIEPNQLMRDRSRSRELNANVPIQIYTAGAEKLPFADNTYDSVVSTLVFCTIPDPVEALKEIARVCKPGGTVLFFEHVKMENAILAKTQDILTPLWKRICDGCHLNRETVNVIEQSELSINDLKYYYKGLFFVVKAKNNK
ncbi:class I SAM-dependent methyltransferase [Aquibacillus sp. 3ASR75-11]|uniref:Class I SAM-dependent methyltransferase n=1 Tax=Terrihalobacillus insolitus TaxID=2950438 RepID=A0A9X3WR55_9BACI|nr:class I SAM-dependent methyltransferase [Terrihalobacillus insolitus]MDC3411971.1 class I SAM-dependent methyltransferase [Terrihalobacillus insolitus]MDC3423343.1 class I SAM-dependent methyltransferase [Terrihalobacillus insolitus]